MDFTLVPIKPQIDIAGFHSVYYFELGKSFYSLPERHDFWEMVFVDEGTIDAIVDGIGCNLQKGQVIFHQPMEKHAHANQGNISNIIVVSFSCESEIMSFFNKKIFTLEKPSLKMLSLFLDEAKNAQGHLRGDYNDRSPLDFSRAKEGSVQLMQCYLVAFLFSLIRSNGTSIYPLEHAQSAHLMAENSMVESVKKYICDHLCDQPSLTELCGKFSISRTCLCRIFKEATGSSPVAYWIDEKIREAKRRIRQDNYNITQISEQLGYSSIHHFCRMFKRVTGVSPTAYKDMVGK